MTFRPGAPALKLACAAVLAAMLSGCIIYSDHDDGYHTAPATADERPADTGSF